MESRDRREPIPPAFDLPEPANAAPAVEADEPIVDAAPPPPAAEQIAALERQVAELKDGHLRALAEVENVRRRGQRERDEAARYGAAGLGKDLLSVADNLRRAIDAVPADARQGEGTLAGLVAGVEMVERELLKAFERNGIQRIDPLGEKFDHNKHQALLEVEHADHPPGHVAQVLQVGYVMHDRLLRPAMVGVAKGAPADAPKVDTTA